MGFDDAGANNLVENSATLSDDLRILILCEDEVSNSHLVTFFEERGYGTIVLASGSDARAEIAKGVVDMLVIDLYITTDNPFAVIEDAAKQNISLEAIAICYMDDHAQVASTQGKGITGLIQKPLKAGDLSATVLEPAIRRATIVKGSRQRLKEVESAMAVVAAVNKVDVSFKERLGNSLHIILRFFGAERGSILLTAGDEDNLEIVAHSSKELVGQLIDMDLITVSTWVVKNGKHLNVENAADFPEFSQGEKRDYKKDSFLSYPIIYDDITLGVMNITDRKEGSFDKIDEAALESFLGRIAATIDNARLGDLILQEREKLAAANKELIKLESMKNNLISMLVHDLKTPIGEIMANLSLLTQAELGEFERDTLLLGQVGAESLLTMVMDILDVSRMEEGKFMLNIGTANLKELAQEKIQSQAGLLKIDNKSMKLLLHGEDFSVAADAAIISRVMQNLVGNAMNYSPDGGTVSIELTDNGQNGVKLEVKDEGPGVPEEFKDRIFMKFGQVEGDKVQNKYSTGLGLTFCKMAIDAHAGEIGVTDRADGAGSSFYFSLPREAVKLPN